MSDPASDPAFAALGRSAHALASSATALRLYLGTVDPSAAPPLDREALKGALRALQALDAQVRDLLRRMEALGIPTGSAPPSPAAH